ncbi:MULTISPECIES: hypothetical protein [unclassified Polaribacter]|uniref:hypothetical protein n=1 Tax=unclassified Polaribacter TaxID=196858 RepID=UPI0014088AF4|nr:MULTISPECIES: hypothetical protein [unclassified Polaribacter]
MFTAHKLGAKMVKVFPSANKRHLLENMEAYKNAGAKAFGMGGFLFDPEMIANKD